MTVKNLTKTYKDFKKVEFPRSPSNDLLDDIFTDLVQYDSHIAGSIDKMLKRKSVMPSEIFFDINLEQRLHKFIAEATNKNDIESANSYLEYLNGLRNLINAIETKP